VEVSTKSKMRENPRRGEKGGEKCLIEHASLFPFLHSLWLTIYS
jgi:hypothetical protein